MGKIPVAIPGRYCWTYFLSCKIQCLRLCACLIILLSLVKLCLYTIFSSKCIQDHRSLKEPSKLFESMVVVGLHPDCDIQALERRYVGRNSEGSGKLRRVLSGHHHHRVEPSLEPQVIDVLQFN